MGSPTGREKGLCRGLKVFGRNLPTTAGNMLTGRMDCPIAQYMDTLYDLGGSDTVHSDKIAYSKTAIGL